MPSSWLGLPALLILLSWAHAGGIKGPPKVKPQAESFISAQVGHQVKLPCPITANPEPIYEWSKDGDPIDETWPRYQLRKHFLKIRSSQLSDSGDYLCKGVNGFGKEQFTFNVHIYEGNLPPLDQRQPPIFTEVAPTAPLEAPLGEEITFICKASGVPEPKISWYKNSSPLHHSGPKLFLERTSLADEGVYSCKAKNPVGMISFNFTLSVQDDIFDRQMEILEMSNVTAVEGFNSSLQCRVRVRGYMQPEIKWFKLLTKDEYESLPVHTRNNTFHREDKVYLSAPSQDSELSLINRTYISKLYIQRTSVLDAGLYVCVGVTPNGYNFKEVVLNVFQGDPYSHLDSGADTESYWLLVVLPILAIITVIVIGLLILRYRGNIPEKSLEKTGPSPGLQPDEPPSNAPLNSYGPHSKGIHPPPPDILYQDDVKFPVHRPMMAHIKGSSRYPDHYLYPEASYLDPNYSEPYLDPQEASALATDSRGYGTRSSDHSYARLTQSTQSSTSPLPPPPYAYPVAYSQARPALYHNHPHSVGPFAHASFSQTEDEPHFVVHYNL